MNTLAPRDTLQYLQNTRDMELDLYELRQYYGELEADLKAAQNPRLNPILPNKSPKDDGYMASLSIGLFIGFIVDIFIFLFNGFEISLFMFVFPILCIITCILIDTASYASERKKAEEKTQRVNEKRTAENERIIQIANRRVPLIQAEMNHVTTVFNQVQSTLNAYYNTNVVYAKYRGLVPITMFCEYFESGRCTTLEGHEGAYNIYENEIRLNLIITKLDDIITRLDRIQSNQYMLANMLGDCTRQIARLSDAADQQIRHMRKIEANTEAAAYYSQLTERNTAYANWFYYLNTLR